jgi:hypothetical protein
MANARGEIIPSGRRVTWQGNVGVANGIPDRTTIYETVPAGAPVATVQSVLTSCPPNQVVQLSAGNYSFGGVLDWQRVNNGVVLRGAGPAQTRITFTNGYIYMRNFFNTRALRTFVNLSADAVQGTNSLTVASMPSWCTLGILIGIDQLDDPTFVNSAGAEGQSGTYRASLGCGNRNAAQLVRVTGVTSKTITIELPLYCTWRKAQQAQVWEGGYDPTVHTPRIGCGIENMSLTANFAYSGANMIKMENCDSCWIKNVEIYKCAGGSAIQTNFCYRCEIRHCNIHHSQTYSAGNGYGVALYNYSCANRVEDNIFNTLHDNMAVISGSSGNAFSYNFETAGKSDSDQNPALSSHGVHTMMNLYEGNYCMDKCLFDFTHGSGSHQTLLRNVILADNPGQAKDQTCVSIEYYNRFCNILGNILGVSGFQNLYMSNMANKEGCGRPEIYRIGGYSNIDCDWTAGGDSMTVSSPIIHGNYDVVNAAQMWDPSITDQSIPNSYLYGSKPAFFNSLFWPPFVPSNPSAALPTNIPAGYRFINGNDPPTTSALRTNLRNITGP